MSATTTRGTHLTAYTELLGDVRRAGLMERRHGYYFAWIGGLILAFGAVWAGVVLLGNSWFQLILAASLAVLCTQFGFIGHDAAHRQIFTSWAWNAWTARLLSGAFAGLSFGWWTDKHSRHHVAPNQEGRDPDIQPGAIAFTTAAVNGRRGLAARISPYQGWLFFPLLLLEGLNLHYESVRSVLRPGVPGTSGRMRLVEGGLIAVRHTGFLVPLFLILPTGKVAAFVGVQLGLFGLMLGASFAPGHKGMPIVPAGVKLDFLRRQVLMSRNVRSGFLTDLAMGGLNYQIEHHLFPTMPRRNLRRAQPMVRARCAELGLPYTEAGPLRSYQIVVRHLNKVGLRGADPFRCPITAAYRT